MRRIVSRLPEDLMGADTSQEDPARKALKCHAVIVTDAQLPEVWSAFHGLDLEGWIPRILDEAFERLDGALLDVAGEPMEVLLEPFSSKQLHGITR